MNIKQTPDVEHLKTKFHYDSETGILTRLHRLGPHPSGSEAGAFCRSHSGVVYRQIRIGMSTYLVHRIAWKMHYGYDPDGQIDHIDGNGLNNCIRNLRVVDSVENHRNERLRKNNESGTMGVSRIRVNGRWRAFITVERRQIHLGVFADQESAVTARKMAEKHYGFHSNHGAVRNRSLINQGENV